MLSQHLVQEFQEIIKQEFGQNLSIEEAEAQSKALLEYFEILIRIDRSK